MRLLYHNNFIYRLGSRAFVMEESAINALPAFREEIQGDILLPGDKGYNESLKRWSVTCEKPASIVVQPASAQDVSAAIKFANTHSIAFTAHGGGHATSGSSSIAGGMVIDLSKHLNEVSVDATAQTITFGGGCRWSDVDQAAWAHGLATVGGTVSHTGVGGLVLGGGFGVLTGKHGLTIDVLLSVELVLADGSVVTASATENPDLFWAARGAGMNFGIATRFTSRAFPQGEVFAGALIFGLDKVAGLVSFMNDFYTKTDGNQFVLFAFVHGPPPERAPCILLQIFHNGPDKEAREGIFAPAFALGPLADMTGTMPYPQVNTLADEAFGSGKRWLFGGANAVPPLDPDVIQAAGDMYYHRIEAELAAGNDMRGSGLAWEILHLDAVLRTPTADSAFANRGRYFNVVMIMNWTNPAKDGEVREWTRKLGGWIRDRGYKVQDGGKAGVGAYNNYSSGNISAEAAFGPNAERLIELKQRYDPENRFDKPWKLSHGPRKDEA